MHADEIALTEAEAGAIIAAQYPRYRTSAVEKLETSGTDNTIFRVGPDASARFPKRRSDPEAKLDALRAEARAMEELALVSPVPTSVVLGLGSQTAEFPMPWMLQSWVEGDTATPRGLEDSDQFADDLAELIVALRARSTQGRKFSGSGRGGALPDHDDWLAHCLEKSEGLLDVEQLRSLWQRLRVLPDGGPDVMSHKDLTPFNVLVAEGRLAGVIDGGGFGPADPALDLVAGWHMLDSERRAILRGRLGCDETEWKRGAAWALQQALGLVWYYQTSNPAMTALGRSTLGRLLASTEISR